MPSRPSLLALQQKVIRQRLKTFNALKSFNQEHPHEKVSVPWGSLSIDLSQVHGIGQDRIFESTLTEREILSARLEFIKEALIDWELFGGVRSVLADLSLDRIDKESVAKLGKEIRRLRRLERSLEAREKQYAQSVAVFKLKKLMPFAFLD